MINRILKNKIEKELFKGKIIIVYGARQVGKTTLVKDILKDYNGNYFNCEIISVKDALSKAEPKIIKNFLGDSNFVVLDEAQTIENIGLILKVLIDTYPDLQIIATGSSSFDLKERTKVFTLCPLSLAEIKGEKGIIEVNRVLEKSMILGLYPEIFLLDRERAIDNLEILVSSYLFKDVLAFEKIKKSSLLIKLLQLLALQIGNEVSYTEFSKKLGVSRQTIEHYIDILEQCFVIFKHHSFSRNLRNELTKSLKVYFYDLGVRNTLIRNFNPLNIRNDVDALWENFCIAERKKYNHYTNNYVNTYFWRTYDQKEIDYIEEKDGKLFAYEFKWKKDKVKVPELFLETYDSEFEVITKDNYFEFLL
jgi:predicted AAA+ superfamily ATPase